MIDERERLAERRAPAWMRHYAPWLERLRAIDRGESVMLPALAERFVRRPPTDPIAQFVRFAESVGGTIEWEETT